MKKFFKKCVCAAVFIILFSICDAKNESVSVWNEILKPIENIPIQDSGIIRSFYYYSYEQMRILNGSPNYSGMSPVQSYLRVLYDEKFRDEEKIIKVTHPFLTNKFGAKKISLNEYLKSDMEINIKRYTTNPSKDMIKPVNEIYSKIQVYNSGNSINIIPSEHEWKSASANEIVTGLKSDNNQLYLQISDTWRSLASSIKNDNAEAGKMSVTTLVELIRNSISINSLQVNNVKIDTFYHKIHPLKNSALFFLLASLFYCGHIIFKKKILNAVGHFVFVAGLLFLIIGMILRWKISGNPPFTNLYESFIMATFGMLVLAYILFVKINKESFITICSAFGFILLVICHNLPVFNSEITPIMPALKSAWLTYHVSSIMLSYSGFAISFFISCIYLLKDLSIKKMIEYRVFSFIPSLDELEIYNYKVIAIGFPLLTIGIITGAIWANIAWGRPWAFDPKETWSAITWIIYASYFHTRLLKKWKGRRTIILSLIGFLAVLFTYFGVNFLLPSIHSYV